MKRIAFEEGYHLCQKIMSVPYDQHISLVTRSRPMVGLDDAAVQSFPNCTENDQTSSVLAEMKLRNSLPSKTNIRVSLERDVEAPFPVDKTCDIVIIHDLWSFLLIACTERIVTHTVVCVPSDTQAFQHLARFLDSKVIYCLTTF